MAFDPNNSISLEEYERQQKGVSSSSVDPFLPNKDKVNELIGKRSAPLDFNVPSSGNKIIDAMFTPQRYAMKGVDLWGSLMKRGEAAIANPLKVLQEGDLSSNLADELIKGVKGEKLAEFGDLVRSTGFGQKYEFLGTDANEVMSSAVGFGASVGMMNLATKGKLIDGSRKIASAFKKGARRNAVANIRKNRFFFKQKADMFNQGVDDAFTAMRHEFDDMYSKIGNNPLGAEDLAETRKIADNLPKSIVNKLKGEVNADVLKPTVGSAKRLKVAIGRSIPKRVWDGIESATEVQSQLMDDYFKLNDVIANSAGNMKPELLRINAKFKSLQDMVKGVRGITRKASGVTKTSIKNIHSSTMQGDLANMEKFSRRFFKDGLDVLKDVNKFNKMIKLKKWGKGIAGAVATYGALSTLRPKVDVNQYLESN